MNKKIIFTGGSGLLGSAMKDIIQSAYFPTHQEFDVEDLESMQSYLYQKGIDILVHMAAFTSPPKIEENPDKALNTNIIGTANVVKVCEYLGIKLIYISTDYVFSGERGNYKEEDPVLPVNKYAWSKLGGECAVRLYDNHIIVRLSFGEKEFPYPGAFIDQLTSREPVHETAQKLAKIIRSDYIGTIHIGSKGRTVYEYAKYVSPDKDIKEMSINDVSTKVPKDTTLNTIKYDNLISGGW